MAHLSVFSKMVLILKLLLIVPIQAIFNIAWMMPFALARGLPIAKYLPAVLLRTLLQTLRAAEIQHLFRDSRATYERWINNARHKKASFKHTLNYDVEALDDQDANIMWVGDRKTAKKIIFFIHGGGYVFPLLDGHLEWCASLLNTTRSDRKEIAVAVLQYTLYPRAVYPTQLRQAACGLQHLLDTGYKAEDIIIGGDSAGGQIACSLLWHLIRPHSLVKPIEGFGHPLAGCFLVSPWISSMDGTDAFKANAPVDLLSPGILQNTKKFMVDHTDAKVEIENGCGWSLPGDVDGSWFDGLHQATTHLYITAGQQELLRDGCIAFARSSEQRNAGQLQVSLDIAEKEAHDFILLEASFRVEGDATKRMLRWIDSIIDT